MNHQRTKHQHTLIAGIVFVLVSVVTGTTALAQTEDAVLAQFTSAVDKYVALRHALKEEVPPLVPNSEPQEILSASDLLAIAIRRARPQAHQGDFFTPEVRKIMEARVAQALANVDFAALMGANDPDERSTIARLETYARLPAQGPLATMPPSVLAALPALPDELEYRFVGSDLVLRDRQARLILDYMPLPKTRR